MIKDSEADLAEALKEGTTLNNFFSQKRGLFKTNRESGFFKKIYLHQLLIKLKNNTMFKNMESSNVKNIIKDNGKYKKDLFKLIENDKNLLTLGAVDNSHW